jgi:hypothetical protein
MSASIDAPGYAPTAYRSNCKTPKPPEPSRQSALFRKSWTMGSPLPKGKLSGLIPPRFLELWDPVEILDNERIDKQRGVSELEERHTYHGRLDEECLRYATLPKTSWALLWMQHGGRILFTWLFPIFLLVMAIIWTQLPENMGISEFFWDGIFPLLIFMFLPMLLCWGFGRLLEEKYPELVYQDPKGPLWELNRRTGMVTLFKDPEKDGQSGEIRAQAPFHEWDGYLLSLPDHQGNIWYRLVLVHQTQEWALPLNQLLAATTNREDVLAYWDLIRQYMDVTRSLPDIPLFEPWRPLDPTTKSHDAKTGRDPRYWRNMSEEDYETVKRKNQKALVRHSWRRG